MPLQVIESKRVSWAPWSRQSLKDVYNRMGLKGFDVSTWYGFFAPANTPRPVVSYLAQQVRAILANPDVQQKFLREGVETVGNTPDEFQAQVGVEVEKWSKVLHKSKAPQS